MRTKSGQALMELAAGMFALALVVSALTVFVRYIVRSLEIENHLRGNQHGVADKIELSDFEATRLFGERQLHIKEPFVTISHKIP